jgi:hypothetical protein
MSVEIGHELRATLPHGGGKVKEKWMTPVAPAGRPGCVILAP